jgi:hypothetical protein
MLISSIIKRYTNTYDTPLNVIMGSCENKSFDFFLRKFVIGNGNLLSFEDSLFGHLSLDLIICNNKITQLEKCMDLAYFFHCPVLVIDHETKPSFLSQDIISFQSNSIFLIAINNEIYNSWNRMHNLVLNFNHKDNENIEKWKNLLYQITKIPFNMKDKKPYEIPKEQQE